MGMKGITRCGGGQGGALKVHGWDKLMLPVGIYLVREGDSHGVAVEEWAR